MAKDIPVATLVVALRIHLRNLENYSGPMFTKERSRIRKEIARLLAKQTRGLGETTNRKIKDNQRYKPIHMATIR